MFKAGIDSIYGQDDFSCYQNSSLCITRLYTEQAVMKIGIDSMGYTSSCIIPDSVSPY